MGRAADRREVVASAAQLADLGKLDEPPPAALMDTRRAVCRGNARHAVRGPDLSFGSEPLPAGSSLASSTPSLKTTTVVGTSVRALACAACGPTRLSLIDPAQHRSPLVIAAGTTGAFGMRVSPVPVQMWQGRAQSRCRCGRG